MGKSTQALVTFEFWLTVRFGSHLYCCHPGSGETRFFWYFLQKMNESFVFLESHLNFRFTELKCLSFSVHGKQNVVKASLNMMAHAQKPDFVFRRNGRVHLNWRGRQFSRLLAAEVWISGTNAGYTMFRGSEKGTGYPLHSSVSPSLPLPFFTVCHHISTGVYHIVVATSNLTCWIS